MTDTVEVIDWALAERLATQIARRGEVPAFDLVEHAHRISEFEDRIEAVTGLRSLDGGAHVEVIDRSQWIAANIRSFRALLTPLTERAAQRLPRVGAGIARAVTGAEVGALLGWMSRRVLGQYDLLLGQDTDASEDGPADDAPTATTRTATTSTATTRTDAVYLVGPNLAGVQNKFGFAAEPFQTWVLLHELTHRAQFTGVPWMRGHFQGLVQHSLSLASPDPKVLLDALRAAVRDRAETRRRLDEYGLAGLAASPEQRAVLTQVAGLMSLLEGHGDVVMSRAADGLVSDVTRFERVMQARRQQSNPLARMLQRLMGLEAKLNQYAAGERFIAAVERHSGARAIDRCWKAPELLPTMDEIRQPELWLRRTGDSPG